MINPKIPFPNIKIGDKDITHFLSSIISSDPIDADRMDYFLRDSYYAGVKYGVYDLTRIKTSFMAVESEGKVYLGLKQSGIDSIKRFIESRYHLFNQIYMHKTNRAANTMLDYCSENIDSIKIPTDDYDRFKQFYWENSDEIFLKKTLIGKINTDRKADFEDLLRRRVWKRVYEMKIWTEPIGNQEEIEKLNAIFNKIDIKLKAKTDIVARLDTYANSPFKEPHKTELRLIRKQPDKKYFLDKNWKSVNKDFISMDYDVRLVKIFLKRSFSSSSDFLEKKSNILSAISEELQQLQDFKYKF
jgi:HD superfamily phosphohydrolase